MFLLAAASLAIYTVQPPHSEQGSPQVPLSTTTIYPSVCADELDGFSQWMNDQDCIDENGSGGYAVISSYWPWFQTDGLDFWGFPAVSTSSSASVYIKVRQYPMLGGVNDMYGVLEVRDGETVTTLWPTESQNIPPNYEWVVLQYPIGHACADWSTLTVDWRAVSGLLRSSICEVDCIWVE